MSKQVTLHEMEWRQKFRRKWLQVCIHSVIYYNFNINIWSDDKWNQTAAEVVQMKKSYPAVIPYMPYSDDLEKFDGCSGYYLKCLNDKRLICLADQLIHYKPQTIKINFNQTVDS